MGGKAKKAKNAGKKAKMASADKADKKRRAKLAEEKTFGMKNKKRSTKVKKFIAQVKQQVEHPSQRPGGRHGVVDEAAARKRAKAEKAARDKELATLFKSALKQPKVPEGEDPKNFMCVFFKQGICLKGNKCKFSHKRKNAAPKKRDLHNDERDKARAADTMDKWDQSKLEEVVAKNEKRANKNRQTDIVCKYFLDAIEREQYGWFWACPNGGKECKYRHALPPGFVFKTRRERELDKLLEMNKEDAATIETIIDEERAKLPATGLTPVTLETFTKWKEARMKRKRELAEAANAAAEKRKAQNRGVGSMLSGRALFSFDPSLFVDDANAADQAETADRTEFADDASVGSNDDGEDDADTGAAGAGAGAGTGSAGAGAGSAPRAGAGAPPAAGAAPPVPPVQANDAPAGAGAAPPKPPPAASAAPLAAAGAGGATAQVGDESLYLAGGDDLDDLDDLLDD